MAKVLLARQAEAHRVAQSQAGQNLPENRQVVPLAALHLEVARLQPQQLQQSVLKVAKLASRHNPQQELFRLQ